MSQQLITKQIAKGFNYEFPNTWEGLRDANIHRIADALEVIAGRWMEIVNSRDYYKGRAEDLIHTNKTLRGHITQLKKKLQESGK